MKTVLIVDDEQIVLEVLQRILSRLGFETFISNSGEDALVKFSNNTFDLVLMDVLMPEKNGFEIAREMKKIRPGQKIIMVTGLGPHAAVNQADSDESLIDSVLSKPFSFEKVKTIVSNVLNRGNTVEKDEVVLSK